MAKNFYGSTTAELVQWGNLAVEQLTTEAGVYHIAPETVAEFVDRFEVFAAAVKEAAEPGTRTPVAIEARRSAEARFLEVARFVVASINTNPLVDGQQRVAIGLVLRKKRTKRHVPESAPGITILNRDGNRVTIRLRDRDRVDTRAVPATADGATIFTFVGETPPLDVAQWVCDGNIGRPKVEISFPAELPIGTPVWITARWYNSHGAGPVAQPVKTVLVGGMVEFRPLTLAA